MKVSASAALGRFVEEGGRPSRWVPAAPPPQFQGLRTWQRSGCGPDTAARASWSPTSKGGVAGLSLEGLTGNPSVPAQHLEKGSSSATS